MTCTESSARPPNLRARSRSLQAHAATFGRSSRSAPGYRRRLNANHQGEQVDSGAEELLVQRGLAPTGSAPAREKDAGVSTPPRKAGTTRQVNGNMTDKLMLVLEVLEVVIATAKIVAMMLAK